MRAKVIATLVLGMMVAVATMFLMVGGPLFNRVSAMAAVKVDILDTSEPKFIETIERFSARNGMKYKKSEEPIVAIELATSQVSMTVVEGARRGHYGIYFYKLDEATVLNTLWEEFLDYLRDELGDNIIMSSVSEADLGRK